jgi:hypothetical protein
MTVIDMTMIEYPWDKPPARLNMATDEVHVWHAELDSWVERVQCLTQILSQTSVPGLSGFAFLGIDTSLRGSGSRTDASSARY